MLPSPRPLSEREKGEGETPIVTVSPATNEIAVSTQLKRSKSYSFDKVHIVTLALSCTLWPAARC